MGARDIIKNLSSRQREILVAHVPQPQPIRRHAGRANSSPTAALMALLLIREDRTGNPTVPHFTVLTDIGREVVAGVLAEYAEALVLAGCLDEAPQIDVRRSPPIATDQVPVDATESALTES